MENDFLFKYFKTFAPDCGFQLFDKQIHDPKSQLSRDDHFNLDTL